MSTDPRTCLLSVILPVRDEGRGLAATLDRLTTEPGVEVLVVDGGSSDATLAVARSFAGVRVFSAPPGRARQMNHGAARATAETLLFLHGDTLLGPGFASAIRLALADPATVAGAFRFRLDAAAKKYRALEILVNLRARVLQMPYGDQGLFLGAETFRELGGFPEQPLMEDFELVRRLRRRGRIVLLDEPALTSARRWQRNGLLRLTVIHQLMIAGYLLGVEPQRLAAWYRRRMRVAG